MGAEARCYADGGGPEERRVVCEMNKRVACFLSAVAVGAIALAVADYTVTRNRAEEYTGEVFELVDSYRFGTAERPLEEEGELLTSRLDEQWRAARRRLEVVCVLAAVIVVVSLASAFRRGRPASGADTARPEAHDDG